MQRMIEGGSERIELIPGAVLRAQAVGTGSVATIFMDSSDGAVAFTSADTSAKGVATAGPFDVLVRVGVSVQGRAAVSITPPGGGAVSAPGISAYSYIFDTDLDSDCDDISAAALLMGMLDSLGGELVAGTVASNNVYAAPYLRVLLDYAGRTSTALGAYKGNSIGGGSTSLYTQGAAAAFGNTNTRADYADALVTLKAALLAAPNKSVRVIVAGTCTNIAELILAYPRLVSDKVEGIYVMGGAFDGSATTENNILYDVAAANVVAAFAGCKKVWAGYEVGNPVNTRITLDSDPALDPYKKGWSLFMDPNPGTYRNSWDLMPVLNAFSGEAGVFSVRGPVDVSFAANSVTSFAANAAGSNYYLVKTASDEAIAALCHSYIDAFAARYQPLTNNSYALGTQLNATASTVYPSPPITISGLFGTAPLPVTVVGGEYQKNGGAWTASPGFVVNGDTIKVRGTSSAAAAGTAKVTLLVGNVPSVWTIVTVAGGWAYEAEATALFARHTTQWATAQKSAANNFIAAAKAAGLWALMDVFYLTADPQQDSQRALLNWKGNTSNGVVSGTGIFTTSGWQGNGTNGFIGSNYAIAAQDSAHIGCYSLTEGQTTSAEMGNTNTLLAVRGTTDVTSYRVNSATTNSTANATGVGHFCASRTASDVTSVYRSGAQTSNSAAASAAPAGDFMRCGGRGGAGISYSNRVLPVFHMGAGLTNAQQATLGRLIKQLLTENGVI